MLAANLPRPNRNLDAFLAAPDLERAEDGDSADMPTPTDTGPVTSDYEVGSYVEDTSSSGGESI